MLNKMILQGRLVKDVELKYTGDGIAVAKVTVAWSEKYKEKETKCFLSCVAWRNTAEFLTKYFAKGQEILLEGKLQSRDYDDKDGKKVYVTEMLIENINFCGAKAAQAEIPKEYTEDLPF